MITIIPSVEGVTCWISDKSPQHKKKIPLASTKVSGGMLRTEGFGNLKIAAADDGSSTNLTTQTNATIAIQNEKVPLLREFLQD